MSAMHDDAAWEDRLAELLEELRNQPRQQAEFRTLGAAVGARSSSSDDGERLADVAEEFYILSQRQTAALRQLEVAAQAAREQIEQARLLHQREVNELRCIRERQRRSGAAAARRRLYKSCPHR